jgi:RNA polymerase sigma-70 factor (ECF subfamily)
VSTTDILARAALPADALAELVRAHQAGVWRFLRTLGCPSAVADELAAEVFVVAHEKGFVARGRAEAAAFLRATARFLWLRRQRRSRRERARFAAAAEALWQRDCARDDGEAFLEALRGCVAALDGRAAAAVQLCYREGLPHTAAAARLGLRPNGLKTLLHRLRAALRECVRRRMS